METPNRHIVSFFAKAIGIIIGLILAFILTEAYASHDPDSINIFEVRVFQNVAQPLDQLFIVEYDIVYAETNTVPVQNSFLFTVTNTAGAIVASSTIQFYGHAIASIYLDANSALTFKGDYNASISPNPAHFTTTVAGINKVTVPIFDDDWLAGNLSEVTPQNIEAFVIPIMVNIGNEDSVSYVNVDGRLNDTGTLFVLAAIPDLVSVVPNMFEVSVEVLDLETTTFTGDKASQIFQRSGSRLSGALQTLSSTFLGIDDPVLAGGIGYTTLTMSVLGLVMTKIKSPPTIAIIGVPMAFIGMYMGVLSPVYVFLLFAMVVVLFGITFVLSRFT